MTDQNPTQLASPPGLPRFLPLLLVLFVGSGCSALIYEIVWFQLLQLVIGSSAVSLAVLLGTFMGGMCLGSLGLPRIISRRPHPLRVYALLELGTGIAGVIVLFVMPYVDRLYISNVVPGLPGILLRGAVSAVCLLPPTLLMGATLPAIARWIEATPQGVSWLGFFYAGNIAGAVFGCLLAGFYLLRVYDMTTATYVAASDQRRRVADRAGTGEPHALPPSLQGSIGSAHAARTGAFVRTSHDRVVRSVRLSAEVIWTRLLSLMLGPTVYTFSIILAVFLTGLGIGSASGSFLARGAARPRLALGTCQMLLAAAIAWAALHARQFRALLADRSLIVFESVVQLSARPDALRLGYFSGDLSVGGQFSAGVGVGRLAQAGPGTIGGRRICGQYGRCGGWRGHVQPVSDPLASGPSRHSEC